MKITYGGLVIFDHALGDGSALSDLDGTIERIVAVVPKARGAQPYIGSRDNRTTQLSFSVSRPNADPGAALAALFLEEAAVLTGRTLRLAHGTVAVQIDGELQSLGLRHHGSRSFHAYRFIGGNPTLAGSTIGDGDDTLVDDDGTVVTDDPPES